MTDFRALCAEGVAFIWSATDPDDLSINADEWAEKANAALIETDEELAKLFTEVYRSGKGERWRAYIRALLARWGNHQGMLTSSMPQPIPVTERLPGAEDCVVISWSEIRSPHVWAGKRRLINGPTEIWDWTFASIPCLEESGEFTHWLPASASVLPAGAIRQSNPSA